MISRRWIPTLVGSMAFLHLGCAADSTDGVDEADSSSNAVSVGSTYQLARTGSGKCLDVADGSTADGANIQQWSCNGSGAQAFKVEDAGNGNVRLVNSKSGKCVDVKGGGTEDGTNIQQWSCTGGAPQTFRIEDMGNGYARLQNPSSGKCVDVSGASGADGANVQLWTCNGSGAQSWKLESSSTSSGSGNAPVFDGYTGYVEIPDNDAYSQPSGSALTVEAWIRPDSLSMPTREGTGYVHWMGKGDSGQHEWVARMYQEGNTEGRGNRISFYAFNLTGGLGTGSYFQDTISTGQWIHVVGEIDATRTFIYRDGTLRDSDLLSDYNITPKNGTAPVRIGTRDLSSFFQGAIARVAIYGAKLSDAQVKAHHAARAAGNYDATILAEPALVGFWRLDEASGTVAYDAKAGRNGIYHGTMHLGGATW